MKTTRSQREQAVLRETARILKSDTATPNVLRALGYGPLTTEELDTVLDHKYRPGTIRGALEKLRLLGLARPEKRVLQHGHAANLWKVI